MAGTFDDTWYRSQVTNRAQDEWNKAQDQYKWAQDEYKKNRAVSDQVINQAIDTSKTFGGYSAADRKQFEGAFPAMDRQMAFATDYASPARMAANRSAAIGGANLAANAARASAEENLTSMGIDPSAGRFAGLDAAMAAKQAATAAAAGTKSDRDTEMLGQQYLSNAIQTRMPMGQVAMGDANVGLGAANQAVNAGLATTMSGAQTMGLPTQWAGLGNDMFKQFETSEVNQSNADLAQQKIDQGASSGTGAMIGAGIGALGSIGKSLPWGQILSMAPMAAAVRRGGSIKRYEGGGSVQHLEGGGAPEPEAGSSPGVTYDPYDMTDQYNTELSPDDEKLFQEWLRAHGRENDLYDYDMRGAWKMGIGADNNGHFPDTYKKPNHPTFSQESIYHGLGHGRGGRWDYDETGTETLQPYDRRLDPRADELDEIDQRRFEHAVNVSDLYARSDELGAEVNRLKEMRQMSPSEYRRAATADDVADAFAHPSYEQRAQDRQRQREQRRNAPYEYPNRELYQRWKPMPGQVPGFASGGNVNDDDNEDFFSMLDGVTGGEDMGLAGIIAGGFSGKKSPFDGPVGSVIKGGKPGGGPFGGIAGLFEEGGGVTPEVEGSPSNMVPAHASPSGGRDTDDVPAMVSVDEFVVPKDVAKWYGEKYFQGLIEKARRDMTTAPAQPEQAAIPQAIALSPPRFRSEGARA